MIRDAFKKLLRAMCVVQKTKDVRKLWPHIRRLEKAVEPSRAYAIVEWPDLEKVCGHNTGKKRMKNNSVLIGPDGFPLLSYVCLKNYRRCCRLMCPVWDDWSGVKEFPEQPAFALEPFVTPEGYKIIQKDPTVQNCKRDMTFGEYLNGKTREEQDAILGAERAKLFRSGEVTIINKLVVKGDPRG